MQHKIEELSGGQKAKILLLKMSMSESNVLILDEPTRYFSPLSNPVIRTMLRNFKGVIITVSHDRKYIEEIADRVYELTDAGLVEVKWKNVDRVPVLFSELSPLNCTNCLKNLKKDVDTLEKPC